MTSLWRALLACFLAGAALVGAAEPAQVGAQAARLRAGPTAQAAVLGGLAAGQRLEILDAQQGFYQIRTEDGREGWVARRLVDALPDAPEVVGQGTGRDPPGQERVVPGVDGRSGAPAEAHPAQAVGDAEALMVALRRSEQALEAERVRGAALADEQAALRTLLWMLPASGFLIGLLAGLLIRELQYRRRLQGLRI